MDVTVPIAPRVRRFVPFVSNKDDGDKDAGPKDVGQNDGAPHAAPSQEFPLMSGHETTDPVLPGSALVRTPSDTAWDSREATVYYRRAVINFCDSEGHVKPRDVKMPIAVNKSAWDGTGTLGAVVRSTSQPRGGGKTQVKERFLVQAPLSYTWNHSRWTSLSKFTTIGGEPVADHVRTSLENEFREREREAVEVKSEKSEVQDTRDWDSDVQPKKKRKTTRSLLEELVSFTRNDARVEQSPRPTKGAASTAIKALKEAHATQLGALKKDHQTALKEALFEERRKHQDKWHEVVGPLKEVLEKAKKKAAEAQVEVPDLTVQVNYEKALRVELEGRLAQGQSLAETLKAQLDAQKEITA